MKWRKISRIIYYRRVQLKIKRKFYYTTIKPVKSQHEYKFNVIEMRMLHWISGHVKKNKIMNKYIGEKTTIIKKKVG